MSASPGAVTLATAVVGSPIALLLYRDLISLDDALIRIGICVVACWAALSVLSALVRSNASVRAVVAEPDPVAPAEPVAEVPSDVR